MSFILLPAQASTSSAVFLAHLTDSASIHHGLGEIQSIIKAGDSFDKLPGDLSIFLVGGGCVYSLRFEDTCESFNALPLIGCTSQR